MSRDLARDGEEPPARGNLRVYFGAAPGVGKTFAALTETRRRLERGTDVVVGLVETHGRTLTAEKLAGLEIVPRLVLEHRGATFTEMDVDAILERHPKVVLVDELAHTNVPGARHEKRWQDVEELLAAGIDVITTVNLQHLESVNDVVERITGVAQRETVPDWVVRSATQIELVDMTAEALRRRLAHGNVYAADKVDAALANYFRVGNLNALRELALLWTADRVDAALRQYRDEHEIVGTWEARERVVVALNGGPEGETLVRRAARIAARGSGGQLLAVHIARSDGLAAARPGTLPAQRRLVESLGGTYHQVLGDDVPGALIAFAHGENATQLVLGESRRSRLAGLLRTGVGATATRLAGDIDVHLVPHAHAATARLLPPLNFPRNRWRLIAGLILALLAPVALTAALVPARSELNLVSDMLLFLLATVLVSLVGGMLPAIISAIACSLLLNYYFTPPLHTLTIHETNNALALFVFVGVAILVNFAVDTAARRTRQAARSAAEFRTIADLTSTMLGGDAALPAMLERVRETFGLSSVTLFERTARAPTFSADDDGWTQGAHAGAELTSPRDATTQIPAGDGRVLALDGRLLRAEDQQLVGAVAAQISVVLDRTRLAQQASTAAALAESNKTRTALLAAAGHDLRTPLAGAKAAVSSLRSRDVRLSDVDRGELLEAADASLDRLAGLVENLLDMSRLQAGAMAIRIEPTALDEVVARALDSLGPGGRDVVIDVPTNLPEARADAGLLERVVANVAANAIRFAPAGQAPVVRGSVLDDRVELRVVDRGPGVVPEDRDRIFLPFQRLGDTDNSTGIGLGLAVARGLLEAMGGTLDAEDTPGGGLTMVLALPAAPPQLAQPGLRERTATGHRDDRPEEPAIAGADPTGAHS